MTVVALAAAAAGLTMGRFGLPPVHMHPPTHYLGIMDPACGMTRASAALGRGDLRAAWGYNPGVFVLAAGALAMMIRMAVAWLGHGWVRVRVRGWPFWLLAAITVAALQVNQQMNAGMLR